MNTKTIMQLHSLDGLFAEKERELKETIGNLQIGEVKDDNKFTATVKRIKQQILLTPVTIGEPKITGNEQTTRQVPYEHQGMLGPTQSINIITVEFSYTGSRELFDYRSGSGSLTMRRIYEPSYNTIPVEVELKELDKATALSNAKDEMATTLQLIKLNNPDVERWAATQSVLIEQMADKKRKELLDFYS